MLNQENKAKRQLFMYLCMYVLVGCTQQPNKKNRQYEKSISTIGVEDYYAIYNKACDSLRLWNQYDLKSYWIRYEQLYKLDSLICFNSNKHFAINQNLNIPKKVSITPQVSQTSKI